MHNCSLIIGKFKDGVTFVVFEDYKFKCCKFLWVCFSELFFQVAQFTISDAEEITRLKLFFTEKDAGRWWCEIPGNNRPQQTERRLL